MGCYGFSTGLPAFLVCATLNIWLTERGVSLHHIGLFSWVTLPYALKIFLAPLIEKMNQYYRYYSLLFAQFGSVFILWNISFLNPLMQFWHLMAWCFCFTVFAALQDCLLEGDRVDRTPEHAQGRFAAANSFGFRLSLWVASALPLLLAHYVSWSFAFRMVACVMILNSSLILMFARGDLHETRIKSIKQTYVQALKSNLFLMKKNGIWMMIFILSFKFADVFVRAMWPSFLVSMHYTKWEIATFDKGISMVALSMGALLGGSLLQKWGMAKSFRVWSLLQSLTALLFLAHGWIGKSPALLALSIGLNQCVGGIGGTLSIAYFSSLCMAPGTLIQYAWLTSMGSLSRIVTTSCAGLVAHYVSWPAFFALAALVCLPCLALTFRVFHSESQK
jgi:PAT family beta-lactamase induction signal transducer AmpG